MSARQGCGSFPARRIRVSGELEEVSSGSVPGSDLAGSCLGFSDHFHVSPSGGIIVAVVPPSAVSGGFLGHSAVARAVVQESEFHCAGLHAGSGLASASVLVPSGTPLPPLSRLLGSTSRGLASPASSSDFFLEFIALARLPYPTPRSMCSQMCHFSAGGFVTSTHQVSQGRWGLSFCRAHSTVREFASEGSDCLGFVDRSAPFGPFYGGSLWGWSLRVACLLVSRGLALCS